MKTKGDGTKTRKKTTKAGGKPRAKTPEPNAPARKARPPKAGPKETALAKRPPETATAAIEKFQQAKDPAEARMAALDLVHRLGKGPSALHAAIELCRMADEAPEALDGLVATMGREGITGALVASLGGAEDPTLARIVLAYRQRLAKELELTRTDEFMVLDCAVEAYRHWLDATIQARRTLANAGGRDIAAFKAATARTAQGWWAMFAECVKTLREAKVPPLEVTPMPDGRHVAVRYRQELKVVAVADLDSLTPGGPDRERKTLGHFAPAALDAPAEPDSA